MEGTTKVSKVFKCPSCPYESKLKGNLKQHVKRVHLKIVDIRCSQCDASFSFKGDLNRHIKAVHDKIKDISCDKCDASFSKKGGLTQHMKAVHNKIKDFKCDRCDVSCSKRGNLTKHVKRVHLKIVDIRCSQCDASFSFKGDLNQHTKAVHDKIKDISCDKCDASFCSQGKLTRHSKICTGKSSMSSMEFKMKQVLDELKIEHMYNSTHDNLKNSAGNYLRFDFIVSTMDESYFMIEMNGQHHYGPTRFGGIDKDKALENFERQLSHDGLKRAYCSKNNYPLLEVKYDDPREYKVILEEFISDNNISV